MRNCRRRSLNGETLAGSRIHPSRIQRLLELKCCIMCCLVPPYCHTNPAEVRAKNNDGRAFVAMTADYPHSLNSPTTSLCHPCGTGLKKKGSPPEKNRMAAVHEVECATNHIRNPTTLQLLGGAKTLKEGRLLPLSEPIDPMQRGAGTLRCLPSAYMS